MSSSKLSIPHDALSNNILDSPSDGEQLPAAGDAELQGLSPSLPSALQSYQKAVAEFLFLVLGEAWTELEVFSLSPHDLRARI